MATTNFQEMFGRLIKNQKILNETDTSLSNSSAHNTESSLVSSLKQLSSHVIDDSKSIEKASKNEKKNMNKVLLFKSSTDENNEPSQISLSDVEMKYSSLVPVNDTENKVKNRSSPSPSNEDTSISSPVMDIEETSSNVSKIETKNNDVETPLRSSNTDVSEDIEKIL